MACELDKDGRTCSGSSGNFSTGVLVISGETVCIATGGMAIWTLGVASTCICSGLLCFAELLVFFGAFGVGELFPTAGANFTGGFRAEVFLAGAGGVVEILSANVCVNEGVSNEDLVPDCFAETTVFGEIKVIRMEAAACIALRKHSRKALHLRFQLFLKRRIFIG
jgi:hypothetical protein